MKHYIKEQLVQRCVECPSVIPEVDPTGVWRWMCRETYTEQEDSFQEIPPENLQGDFPTWCPYADIKLSVDQWDAQCATPKKEKSRRLLVEQE